MLIPTKMNLEKKEYKETCRREEIRGLWWRRRLEDEGDEESFRNCPICREEGKIVEHTEMLGNEGIERNNIGKDKMEFRPRERHSGVDARYKLAKLR